VTVTDGTTSKTIDITASFDTGAWLHFPISVAAGGSVVVTAVRTGGPNAVVSGLFLGGPGSP
jgi:hypothetical protein